MRGDHIPVSSNIPPANTRHRCYPELPSQSTFTDERNSPSSAGRKVKRRGSRQLCLRVSAAHALRLLPRIEAVVVALGLDFAVAEFEEHGGVAPHVLACGERTEGDGESAGP